jgi:hypothetical protein
VGIEWNKRMINALFYTVSSSTNCVISRTMWLLKDEVFCYVDETPQMMLISLFFLDGRREAASPL